MKIFFTITLSLVFSLAWGNSFSIPNDDTFYNPDIKSYQKTIVQPSADADQSSLIQSAIDEVNSKGGGILYIEGIDGNQTYNLVTGVSIKSDVHIRVSPNVIFKSNKTTKVTLFSAGKDGDERITNFSISCTDETDFFMFDFSDRIAGEKDGGAIAVSLGGVANFRLADIKVIDNYTQFSCVTVNLMEYEDALGATKYMFAKDGIIEHMETTEGHYGYGSVQCQAAINVLYRNLIGEGGATLRLETGAIGKANLVDKSIKINMVYGTGIKCTNGQAVLTLSPHTVYNGKVFIDDLTAISCETGAIVAAGFLSAKKGQADADGNAIDGYVYGYFDSESIVSNLKVYYGEEGQLRPQRRTFVPCSQKHLIHEEKNADEESYEGPTVAGMVYFAKAGTDIDFGYYTVNTPDVEMLDFPLVDGVMENKEYVVSTQLDGHNTCPDVGLGNDIEDANSIKIYYSSSSLIINAPVGSRVLVYDISGVLLKAIQKTMLEVTNIELSDVKHRICIVSVSNKRNSEIKKVLL